jgi:hypothetical protein
MKEQRKRLLVLRDACKSQRYPFTHPREGISLGEFLLEQMPAEDDLGAIMEASRDALQNCYGVHYRALAQLAQLALAAEQATAAGAASPAAVGG